MNKGWIEVITGGMFSGKTEELVRRITRAKYARLNIQLFKPQTDDRYSKTAVVSHSGLILESVVCETASDILSSVRSDTQVVGIDEAQFFEPFLPDVCDSIAQSGSRVILAGLDMDSQGKPFGPMPILLAKAEKVTKLRAICTVCGSEAGFSQRLKEEPDNQTILVGGSDRYEARCRDHFTPRG